MGAKWPLAVRTIIIVFCSVVATSVIIHAAQPTDGNSQSYAVLASVQPARYIVVDSNLQIIEVVSNTREDVIPYVVMNSLDGAQIPYTNAIQSQFTSLKSSMSFAKAGVVFQRHSSGSISSACKNAWHRIRVFIFGS